MADCTCNCSGHRGRYDCRRLVVLVAVVTVPVLQPLTSPATSCSNQKHCQHNGYPLCSRNHRVRGTTLLPPARWSGIDIIFRAFLENMTIMVYHDASRTSALRTCIASPDVDTCRSLIETKSSGTFKREDREKHVEQPLCFPKFHRNFKYRPLPLYLAGVSSVTSLAL